MTTFQEMRTLDSMYTFVVNQVEGTDRGSVPIDKENWEDLPSSVVHLNKETYQEYLQQTEHVLVTFHVRCECLLFFRSTLYDVLTNKSRPPWPAFI